MEKEKCGLVWFVDELVYYLGVGFMWIVVAL